MQQSTQVNIHKGRLVIPSEWRKQYGIEDDKPVILTRTAHGIEIRTVQEAIRQAQALCAQYVKPDVSLVDELIRDRREEAARE